LPERTRSLANGNVQPRNVHFSAGPQLNLGVGSAFEKQLYCFTEMKLANLESLLIHELKDLYSAETQLIKALPKMAKAATSEALKSAFEEHLEQTEQQKVRLDEVFKLLDGSPRGQKCKAMEGLIEEGQDIITEEGDEVTKDAALIAAAQRVEHYEIAGYGAARAFAEILEKSDVADLLQETLDEEKETDQKLTELAMSEINLQAAEKV